MRIGTALPQRRIDSSFIDVARECEDLGYDSLSVFDHLVPLGAPDGTPVLESFTTLAAVAAATQRIGLVTLVVRAAMRPPAMTAHLARTLVAVAGERVVLGIGAGDAKSAREDAMLGRPSPSPGERRDAVRATVAAVRDAVPDLTIWVGGNGAPMRALAAEVEAHAWNCWALAPDEIGTSAVPITWGGQVELGATPDDVVERLHALEAAGVTEALVAFVGGKAAEQRRVFAREVLPRLR